ANAPGANGTYNLSDGSLRVNGPVTIGAGGIASFNQTGGTFSAGSNVTLALDTTASATGVLSGARTLMSVSGAEIVGGAGTARFYQTAGVHGIVGTLTLGGAGTYNLSGGSLS